MLIEWKDQYSLGNEALDFEHQQLIDLINQVHEAIERSQSENNETRVLEGLAEIQNAVTAHFALEEREMRMKAYAQYAEHKADHEKLLDEIGELIETVEDEGVHDIRSGLSSILEAWFSVHFQTFDRDYHIASRDLN